MPIPGQNFTILDPGLAVTPEAINTPIFFGCSSAGEDNHVYTFGRVSDVVDTLKQGPLAEALCTYLALAGGPVYAVKLVGSAPGKAGTVNKTPINMPTSPGTLAVGGAPHDSYDLIVEITKSGGLGVAEFRYSLDGGSSFSASMSVPSSGTYPVPNANITLTFAGTATAPDVLFDALDRWECDCLMPVYDVGSITPPDKTGLAAGIEAALASSVEFSFMVLTGTYADSQDGALVAAAAAGHAQSMFNDYRFIGALVHSGIDAPLDAIEEFKDVADPRIGVCYSFSKQVSNKPFVGWGVPWRPSVDIVAARAGQVSISTDLGRVASGSLTGVVAIEHDEFRNEIMDAKRFITLRTFQGVPGYFITNGRLMSPLGSDYKYWQHRRCMDVACDVTYKAQVPIINKSVRVNADGTIDDRDARTSEARVKSQLSGALLDPNNAEGTAGHVSAVDYKIDRATNVLGTETIKTNVAIRPLGYAKILNTELGFSASAGG